ncbi:hypothetical protein TNCV_3941741 [Trichonephila clavipes]|uniref:Uncharacterized protein n=1 Tax=Trichonephila clavipes TaxID=2585209 RepID=A0A8X6VVU8_TRICX|nr:hypothetical protein TNCV_3941741 [Trichonephila clavipes]
MDVSYKNKTRSITRFGKSASETRSSYECRPSETVGVEPMIREKEWRSRVRDLVPLKTHRVEEAEACDRD